MIVRTGLVLVKTKGVGDHARDRVDLAIALGSCGGCGVQPAFDRVCPDCGRSLWPASGCSFCPSCGWSRCQ